MFGILDPFYRLFWIVISVILGALYAIVVRTRVNYTPRELVMHGAVPNSVDSFVEMARRIERIQGLSGFFRGAWPVFLLSMIIGFIASTPLRYFFPSWLFQILITLVDIPVIMTLHRAITTPHTLYLFQPIRTLTLIYTPYELRRPFILFLTPGILVAESLRLLYIFGVIGITRRFLFIWISSLPRGVHELVWIAVALAGTVILSPLEVVSARLSVQYTYGEGGVVLPDDTEAQYRGNTMSSSLLPREPVAGPNAPVEGEQAQERVVCLRQDTDRGAYEGWTDCVRSIWREEGISAFWRGWGWTFVFLVLYGIGPW